MTTLHIFPTPELSALAKKAFGYAGRTFAATAAESFTLLDYVDLDNGGSWSDYAIVRGDKCESVRDGSGAKIELNASTMLLQHSYFCGHDTGITIYCHPALFPQLLPAGEARTLTTEQQIVLVATRSYKASYAGNSQVRYHEAARQTGITRADWERSKVECQGMGLLDKRGAITLAGKNAIGNTNLWTLRGQGSPVTAE